MDLNLIAAEYIAAMQQVLVLALRTQSTVTSKEVSDISNNLPRFLEMGEPMKELVKKIRKERYGIV